MSNNRKSCSADSRRRCRSDLRLFPVAFRRNKTFTPHAMDRACAEWLTQEDRLDLIRKFVAVTVPEKPSSVFFLDGRSGALVLLFATDIRGRD